MSRSLPHLRLHRILIFYLVEFVRRIFIIIIIAIMYFIDVESPPVALLVHAPGSANESLALLQAEHDHRHNYYTSTWYATYL